MPDECIVQLESLGHRYGSRLALTEVTFNVRSASLFALLGPNGCGKTTLFKILTTLLTPTSGAAYVGGANVVTQRRRVLERIGVVFQKPALDSKLTVLENLIHQGQLYGLSGRSLKTRSLGLLERFGIADRAHERIETLSGGLQRRVELAKGLLHKPDLLILDEPSTGLDPGARLAFMRFLAELRDLDGVTCLLTTHLMDEADRCDVVAVLDEGRLVALDTPEALKNTVGGDVVTIGTMEPDALSDRVTERFGVTTTVVDGVVRVERERGHEFVPQLIEAFPGEVDSVTVGKPTLDDVFMRFTGRSLCGPEEAGTGAD